MSKYKMEIRWALIFTAMMLFWHWLEKATGLHDEHIDKHFIYTNLVAIPAILIYVLALREKRGKAYQGFMTYREGFKTGLLITVIIAVLSPLVQLIASTLISPDFFTNIIEYTVGRGDVSQAGAESLFNLRSYMLQSFTGALAMGLITSALVSLFVQRKPPVGRV
jgi:hypothetical protein